MIYIIELNRCYEMGSGKILGYTKDITVAQGIKGKYEDSEKFYITIIEATDMALE